MSQNCVCNLKNSDRLSVLCPQVLQLCQRAEDISNSEYNSFCVFLFVGDGFKIHIVLLFFFFFFEAH